MRSRAAIHRRGLPHRGGATLPPVARSPKASRLAIRNLLYPPRLQPKLTVGPPDDAFEREADRTAEAVMRMPEGAVPVAQGAAGTPPALQRACPACEEEMRRQPEEEQEQLRRQPAEEEEQEIRRQPAEQMEEEQVRRQPAEQMEEEQVRRQPAEEPAEERREERPASPEEEEEKAEIGGRVIQAKARPAEVPEITPDLAPRLASLQRGGAPLPAAERSFFEPRFGSDFGGVRIHADAAAADLAGSLKARAFTLGGAIVFGRGEYAPGSTSGRRLLAHELTHAVQQGAARPARDRGAAPPARHEPAPGRLRRLEGEVESAQFLQAGWTEIHELGIVYKQGPLSEGGGANLRETPGGTVLRWLPQNTKVFILSHNATEKVYAVTTLEGGGQFGYIAQTHLWRYLPDPESDVLKVKPGDTPIDIAREHYAAKGFNIWGKDARYVVNALVWVNSQSKHNGPGGAGISKEKTSAPWYTAKATSGVYIWLPGPAFLNAIYETVAKHGGGTGSITADLWRGLKKVFEYVAYGLAFVGGLVHGFVKSLYDAVAGLVGVVVDVLVSIFTGSVVSDAKELWEAISKLTWEDIKEAVGEWALKWDKKLNSDSPWVAGHAHGYLTGYVMAEAAQLLVSAGTLAAAKAAIWGSRLGKAIQATRAYRALAKGIEKAGEAGGKAKKVLGEAASTLRKSKPFTALAVAREWVAGALLLTAETVKELTLEGINKLRTLADDALERLRKLAEPLKRTVLGCASPCKVDIDEIKKYLDTLAGKATAGVKLTTIDEVLAALPAGLEKSLIKSKLKAHPALLEAIKKAELTADDLAVVGKFLTPADAANAASAYRTFTRTLTSLVPAKVGGDVKKFNELAEAIILLEPRAAAALKGPMFETFAKLNLGRFRNLRFDRATFSKAVHKTLNKSRTSDGFIDSAGALWDFKHTFDKVPKDQVEDYLNILANGLKSTEGKTVKSVNYLFPTYEAAKTNADLLKKGFSVFYVTPPDVVTKFK
jgi:hypothetical protein